MRNADALSRLPVKSTRDSHDCDILVLIMECLDLPPTAKNIGAATKKDPVLSQLLEGIVSGRRLIRYRGM